MTRITIKPTKVNLERGEALRLAAVDGRNERMHVRITELDRDYERVQAQLRGVVAAAGAKFKAGA